MSDPIRLENLEHDDRRRELRLEQIRTQAERTGKVQAIGARPAGAPFPQASPENGYYRIPLLKEPPWTWEIPLYFFVGGAAGAAAVISAIADYAGADRELAKHAQWIAFTGREAKRSRARQRGMRLSIGISTALHRRNTRFVARSFSRSGRIACRSASNGA